MTTAPDTQCWAIVYNGVLDIRTVMPHRRGAIVNWLATEKNRWLNDLTSDEMIEQIWNELCSGAIVVPVKIEVINQPHLLDELRAEQKHEN